MDRFHLAAVGETSETAPQASTFGMTRKIDLWLDCGRDTVIEEFTPLSNTSGIRTQMTNVDGARFDFVIQPGHAAIDSDGIIRFFSVEYEDDYIGNYKLLPKHSKAEEITTWITKFLVGLGLSRAGANIMKGNRIVDHVGRYAAFGNPGGQAVQSFIGRHFLPEHLGYFNAVNDKLIFPNGPLYAPDGTW
jgi:hypothetical protein